MKIGMTGTRNGMTSEQKRTFERHLTIRGPKEFHHGDCIGADADGQAIALRYKSLHNDLEIVSHPPIRTAWQAFTEGNDTIWPRKDYKVRDRDIVNQSDVLLAIPKGYKEEMRGSGTWLTVRMARKANKHIIIIFPDGSISEELPRRTLLDG